MAKSDVTFPAIRIKKKVEGYKQAVDRATKEAGLEFFNDYLMPMAKARFAKFEWHKTLKKGLVVRINRSGEIYRFRLDSTAVNDEGKNYFSEVLTGKPPRLVKFTRLRRWVKDKVYNLPKGHTLNSITRVIQENILEEGSEPKPEVLLDIQREAKPLIESEFKLLLQRKIKSVRRRFSVG